MEGKTSFEEALRRLLIDYGNDFMPSLDGIDLYNLGLTILEAHEAELDRRVLEARIDELLTLRLTHYWVAHDLSSTPLQEYVDQRIAEIEGREMNYKKGEWVLIPKTYRGEIQYPGWMRAQIVRRRGDDYEVSNGKLGPYSIYCNSKDIRKLPKNYDH